MECKSVQSVVFMFMLLQAVWAEPLDIGSRLELLVDDYLIDSTTGDVSLRLHHPVPREIVMVHDEPWEGSGCGYHTVFRDGDIYRMYYKAWHLDPQQGKLNVPHDTFGAYAESKDGVHWVKPELGLFEFEGSKANNIVWMGRGSHDFTPFIDENPNCPSNARYKAIASAVSEPRGALAFKSADGIHWSLMQELRVMTKGYFDTQNIAFWDTELGAYRAYIRDFHDGVRDIRTATSKDFIHWTEPVMIKFPGRPDVPLYTNQVKPYYRARHILIGFPTRYSERGWSPSMEALPDVGHRRLRSSSSDRYGMAVTDALFMTSRDGLTFNRWDEAFLRPGLRTKDNWAYGDNYIAWHVVETESTMENAPPELSLYATESYWTGDSSLLRRFTLRIDGFVSAHAGGDGGEFVTKPLVFKGEQLALNFSTSAAGVVRIEIQDEAGAPIEGFALEDAPEIFGDSLDRVAPWKDGNKLTRLAGKPVRLRFVMRDADLYSFTFK